MDQNTAASHGDLVTGGGRNLEELMQEVLRRVERNIMPLGGITVEDARAALAAIDSLSREQWAQAWSRVAEQHYAKAQSLEAADRDGAAAEYWHAWRLHHFARWPIENTPAKRHAKSRALDAFQQYCRLLDPVIEVVRIPFESKEIVAYLRLPASPRPAPVVLGIAGLDSRKEDVAAYTDRYLKHGIAIMAVDLPGTGESPHMPAEVTSDRMFSAMLDYLEKHPGIDGKRMVVQGRSASGYWAAKLAYTERARLRGAVVHGGAIHKSFQAEWMRPALKTGEYLYDYLEAKEKTMGASGMEDLLEKSRHFSLLDQGLLDQPSAPMLVINGARDSQTSVADVFLLLEHGNAKEAWVNPKGGHMGRSPEWSGSAISEKVVMPWIVRQLQAQASGGS